MNTININLSNVSKSYNNKNTVINSLNYNFSNGNLYSITGSNGSGKSTLLKMIAGLLNNSNGDITWVINSDKLNKNEIYKYFGFVSPYLNIYEEFNLKELIDMVSKIKGIEIKHTYINFLINEFGLSKRSNEAVRGFSSGMKQRVKFIIALINQPNILLLDEPYTNFDENGKEVIKGIIKEIQQKDGLVIIASNEKEEIELCNQNLYLNSNF